MIARNHSVRVAAYLMRPGCFLPNIVLKGPAQGYEPDVDAIVFSGTCP